MKSFVYGVAFLLAGTAFAQDKPKLEKKTSYFPLDEGSSWTYTVQGKTVVTKVVGFEKVGEDVCAKLETRNGKDLVATEYFTVKDDGVYRCQFADKKVTPPVAILKLPVKNNDTWKFKSKVGDQETEGGFTVGESKGLKIGKMTYDAITVTSKDLKIDNQPVTTTYYFADKVGLVKQVVDIAGSKVELELEKFEEKK